MGSESVQASVSFVIGGVGEEETCKLVLYLGWNPSVSYSDDVGPPPACLIVCPVVYVRA